MKLKRYLVLALLATATGSSWAQTDVTNTYLINPSFELKAEGTASTAADLGSNKNASDYYGWTTPKLGTSYCNVSIGNSTTCNGQGLGIPSASDGDFYFFNRKGWATQAGELSQTATLPAGKYFVTVDYKAYEKTTTNGTLGFKINDTQILTTKPYYAYDGNNTTLAKTDPWKTIGAWFTIETEGKVKIAITENLVGGKARADLYLDNVKLYKWDLDDEVNYNNATAETPLDVTAKFVKNPYFDDNVNDWTSTTGYQNINRAINIGGAISGGFFENWNPSAKASGKTYQTLTGLVDGIYRLTATVMNNNAGANISLYIGSGKTAVTGNTTTNYSVEANIAGGTAEIGYELGDGNAANWIGIDNVKLEYLGFDLTEAKNALSEKITQAEALLTEKMNASALVALNTAIEDANNVPQNKEALTNATSALTTAIANAETSINIYTQIAAVNTKAEALDDAGQAAYAATLTAYNNGSLETLAQAAEAYRTAVKAQTTPGSDFTGAIINNSFEAGFSSGWTNGGMDIQGNTSLDMKDGNNYCEKWQPNGTVSVKQVISSLPMGQYKLTVTARTRGTKSGYIYINDTKTDLDIDDTCKDFEVIAMVEEGSDIEIGFSGVGTGAASSWFAIDNFRLTLISKEFPALIPAEGKMNADIAAAQTAAISTFNTTSTIANWNAANNAIKDAQASVEQYAANAIALAEQKALIDGSNIYNKAGYDAYVEAYNAKKAAYDNNTLNEELTNPAVTTGWHASTAYNFLLTPWKVNEVNCNEFAAGLYINTWSNEGIGEGKSGMTPPFFEYFKGKGTALSQAILAGVVSDVPNGLYEVSALVRVMEKDETAQTEETTISGITLGVNDGEATNVCNGTIGTGNEASTRYGIFTAQGLVKDGNLTVKFNVEAENNAHWLAFKNVKYTKLRDLTAEESAVKPTAITLNQTAATLYMGESVTLTAAYTPADATQTVTWTSSNETVAKVIDGVVTAVGYGEATVTVKSTLAEVSASATITVTAPGIDQLQNLDFAEGANATVGICTYEKDKTDNNTSYAQMLDVPGWKMGIANGDARAAGVITYGSGVWTGNKVYPIPAQGPEGTNGNALSMIGVWGGMIQYVQDVKFPAGEYAICVTISNNSEKSNISKNLIGFIEANGTEHLLTTKTYAKGTWTEDIVKFTLAEDTYGKLSVGYEGTNVGSDNSSNLLIDNVRIINGVEIAKMELKKELEYTIPSANIGNAPFQYPAEGINTIKSTIQTAQQVYESTTATKAEVEAQTTIMKALSNPQINNPAAGQTFHAVLTFGGWTYDNKVITPYVKESTQGGYALGYRSVDSTSELTFTPVAGEKNTYTISFTDADATTRYISTGVPHSGNTSQIRTVTDAEKALKVKVIPTATEGVFNLLNTEANNYIGSQDEGVFTVDSHRDFKLIVAFDANLDNTTDKADVEAIVNKLTQKSEADVLNADANHDGNITIKDAVDIINHLLKK